jgi:hypothetical protein
MLELVHTAFRPDIITYLRQRVILPLLDKLRDSVGDITDSSPNDIYSLHLFTWSELSGVVMNFGKKGQREHSINLCRICVEI